MDLLFWTMSPCLLIRFGLLLMVNDLKSLDCMLYVINFDPVCQTPGPKGICSSQSKFYRENAWQSHWFLSEINFALLPLPWHVQKYIKQAVPRESVVNCLTACPGKMRWLNCALVNLIWHCLDLEDLNYHCHLESKLPPPPPISESVHLLNCALKHQYALVIVLLLLV